MPRRNPALPDTWRVTILHYSSGRHEPTRTRFTVHGESQLRSVITRHLHAPVVLTIEAVPCWDRKQVGRCAALRRVRDGYDEEPSS